MKTRNYVAKHAKKFNKTNIHRNRKGFYKKTKHKSLTTDYACDSVCASPTNEGEN